MVLLLVEIYLLILHSYLRILPAKVPLSLAPDSMNSVYHSLDPLTRDSELTEISRYVCMSPNSVGIITITDSILIPR